MILTCPSCATSYFTPDDAIGPGGRTVRCQSCANTWRAMPDEPLELTTATASISHPVSAPVEERSFGKRDEAVEPESLADTPAAELPGAFRAKAEQQRRLRRAAAHGVVWAGLASVFLGLLGAAWLFRVEVVQMAPRAASAYAAVGLKVNPTGLEFEALTGRTATNDPGKIIVSGALRNVREAEIVAPPVRVALLDSHGAEIGHAIVRIDAAPVLPGKVQGFAAVIPDPGSRGVDVAVDFAPEAPPVKAAAHAPVRAATHPPAHSPVNAEADHGPPPAAESSGLRPAMAPLEPAPANLTPIDAKPIDSHPAQAVSPSHGER